MLKKFVIQNLQLSDCDKLFSLHNRGRGLNNAASCSSTSRSSTSQSDVPLALLPLRQQ